MREIKFRGKRIDNGEWVYGGLVTGYGYAYIHKLELADDGVHNIKVKCVAVDPETVGQFTGLSDKNSVDIYEGDLVDITSAVCTIVDNKPTGKYSTRIVEVCWLDRESKLGRCCWATRCVGGDARNKHRVGGKPFPAVHEPFHLYGTVCGNIHDTPELLEGK